MTSRNPNPMRLMTVLRKLSKIFAAIAFAVMALCPAVSFADSSIYINSAKIDRSGNYYRLTTTQSINFSNNLIDTLQRGVPLYFKTELEMTSRQLLWFDMTALSKTRTRTL